MKRIGNSTNVQKKVGERLTAARGDISRKKLATLLLNNPNAPQIRPRGNSADGTLPEERLAAKLKQVEYGVNPIDIEWLPAICDVLHCDVGYIFGEYPERTRTKADVCTSTGLTEDAVTQLIEYDENVTAFISYLLSNGAINQIGLSVSQCIDTRLLNEHYRKVLEGILNPQLPQGDASDTVLDILSKRTKVIDEMKRLDEVYTSRLWRAEKDAGTAIETFIDKEVEKYGKNE